MLNIKQESKNTNKKQNRLLIDILIIFLSVAVLLACVIIRYNVIEKRLFEDTVLSYASMTVIYSLCFSVILFVLKNQHSKDDTPRMFGVICFIISITFIICIFIEDLSIYAMPITLAVLLLSVFFNTGIAFLGNVFSTLMIYVTLMSMAISAGDPMPYWFLPLMIFSITAGTILSIIINKDTKRFSFILYGIIINSVSIPLIVLNEFIDLVEFIEFAKILPYTSFLIFGTVLIALMLQPIIEVIFNINSNFRLIELCDHRRPLLLNLAKNAPGTFNHSLTVANLAETCARAINENTYFARAAAYYHDVGKLKNTRFFKENQFKGANPHDGLTPEASIDIIRKHALQGMEICKEYHIPQEIAQITVEHHGTMPIKYFYYKAKEMTDRELDIKDYSYLGQIPTTKTAAIIMICDAAEATVRSMKEHSYDLVEATVKEIIEERLRYSQFDACDITMKDLAVIKDTIVEAFGGLYHERIKYPGI